MHHEFEKLRRQLSRQRSDYYTRVNRLNADEAENTRRVVEDTMEIYFQTYGFKPSVREELKKVILRNLEHVLKFPANMYKGHRAIEELKDNRLDYLAAPYFRRWEVTMSQMVQEYVDCQQGKKAPSRCSKDVFDFDEPSQSYDGGERFDERFETGGYEPTEYDRAEASERRRFNEAYDRRRLNEERYDNASESRYDERYGISEVERERD